MKKRVLRVRDGNLIPMGNNFAYVLGDYPNKTDDVDIGPNNKNGLSVNHGEIMQFNRNGVRVFSAEPIFDGVSPSQLVQAGMNPNAVFAAQERYKDIHHLKDDGRHTRFGDWVKGLFGINSNTTDNTKVNTKSNEDWRTANVRNEEMLKRYEAVPLQGNPLYDITGATKYWLNNLDDSKSRKFIVDTMWAMENPYNKGLNKDGTYSPYGDPNGKDQDVGPGILLSNLPYKEQYTKQELEDYVYNKVLKGRDSIRQSFDKKYGTGEYDKLDESRKYILDDVRYRNGTVSQAEWPSLYQAIYDNNIIDALVNSRTTFKNKAGYDNSRVERLAQKLYPDIVVEHKGNKDSYLKVYKKK